METIRDHRTLKEIRFTRKNMAKRSPNQVAASLETARQNSINISFNYKQRLVINSEQNDYTWQSKELIKLAWVKEPRAKLIVLLLTSSSNDLLTSSFYCWKSQRIVHETRKLRNKREFSRACYIILFIIPERNRDSVLRFRLTCTSQTYMRLFTRALQKRTASCQEISPSNIFLLTNERPVCASDLTRTQSTQDFLGLPTSRHKAPCTLHTSTSQQRSSQKFHLQGVVTWKHKGPLFRVESLVGIY